jgi:hypothetical protein
MIQSGITAVIAILILATVAIGFYVLLLMYREKGLGHAVLGFIITPYSYVWGWLNAKRLKIIDIMFFWTVIMIIAIIFPIVISFQEAAKAINNFDTGEFATVNDDGSFSFEPSLAIGNEDAIEMGSIGIGSGVEGRIDDLFAVQNWTFNGSAGQQVTIQANAANGDGTDPRINLIGPDGTLLTGDDDGGKNRNALISAFTLPASGRYIIQVDVWETGRYEITLN